MIRALALACLALAAAAAPAAAQETVTVTVPVAVGFQVTDVSVSTPGSPAPTIVSYSDAQLVAGNALRISVKAESADFTPPSGTAIPASKVSWSASNAQGGAGSGGTLSDTTWGQVFQSAASPSSGGVDLTWTIAAPGAGIRAGSHHLTVRWKLESVIP